MLGSRFARGIRSLTACAVRHHGGFPGCASSGELEGPVPGTSDGGRHGGPRAHAEFREYVAEVVRAGLLRERQLGGHRTVCATERDKLGDLALPAAERRGTVRRRRAALASADAAS